MLKRAFRFLFIIFTFVNIIPLRADTIDLIWKNGDTTYAQSTCAVGGDVEIPLTHPTKTGYNFVGWDIKKVKELEYVSFSNMQYIDTGIMFDSDEIEYETKFYSTSSNIKVFGAANSASGFCGNFDKSAGFVGFGSNALIVFAGNSYNSFDVSQSQNGEVYIVRVKKSTQSVSVKYNNEEISFAFSGTPVSNKSIYIGGVNCTNAYHQCFFNGNIYYFKIKKDGVLVRDFIPVKDTNYVVCMYDRVSKTFFYTPNGVLGAGPEVQ